MRNRKLISEVARKEIREIVRDGRLRLLGGIVLILTFAALAFGVQQTVRSEHTREHAQERADAQWQGQGERNPHEAAHYGTYVFAPTSVVTAIDPGLSSYLGRSIKMEAHKRNLASHAAARDGGGLQRLGSFSVASVLLMLVPLLIIALGYGLWSRERESGTLRQLLATGVDRGTLFWGKAIALATVVGMLLVPAGIVIVTVLWIFGGGDATTFARLGLLALSYAIYFAIFGALTLAASARFRSARGALVAMIGVWGLFCLISPRVATEVAGATQPLPSRAELAREVSLALEKGLDGKTDRKVAIAAITKDLMASQGVEGGGMLMADASYEERMALQAKAKWENDILTHVMGKMDAQLAAQEGAVEWAGFVSPFVAMRTLSAGFAGTDVTHHQHFTTYAESWRQAFISHLNKAFEGWDAVANAELWKKAPPFAYQPPSAMLAVSDHLLSVLALLFWLVLSLLFAWRSAHRLEVV